MALIEAVEKNDLSEIKRILADDPAAVSGTNPAGWTALHFATLIGSEEIAALLLEKGADIQAKAKNAQSVEDEWNLPLHMAAELGYPQLVKLYIEKGAVVEARNSGGFTALHLAVMKGSTVTSVEVLVQDGKADVTQKVAGKKANPLHLACARFGDKRDIAEFLLANGGLKEAFDDEGMAPLHLAALHGNDECCKVLLVQGAGVNVLTFEKQRTPCHLAAIKGFFSIVRILVETPCRLDAIDKDGRTPLHLACLGGHLDAAKQLVEGGAKLNAADGVFDCSPMHLAAQAGSGQIVALLLDNDAKKGVDRKGRTPLHVAAYFGKGEVVRILLDRGVNIEVTEEDKKCTPLHLAAQEGKGPVITMLLQRGADVTAVAKGKKTALHWAAMFGHLEAVITLLDNGAELNPTTIDDETPLDVAIARHDLEHPIVKYLVERGGKQNISGNKSDCAVM